MLETTEARARLRHKLETWPDDRKCPVTINQVLDASGWREAARKAISEDK